jgi:HSP20 family protein
LFGQSGFPPVNFHVTADDAIVEMAIPGVKPDEINIAVTGDTLTVSGEVKRQRQSEAGQPYFQEIYEGQFQRSFTLPFPVDSDKASASVENGMLTLTLPKAESIKPRKIQVSQGSGQPTVQRETVSVQDK